MIETYLRQPYQDIIVNPVAHWIGARITPNQITGLSVILGLLVLPALFFHQVALAIILLLLSGFCDTLDGTLARYNHSHSTWGSVLDIMADRLVEFTLVFGLWSLDPKERSFWCILMLGSMLLCITSFLVVGIFSTNTSEKSFHYSPGLMERAEAFVFFIAMMAWPQGFNALALMFTLLVTLTALIRLGQFYKQQE